MKGIAGFYYVHVVTIGVFECKAKGIFRNRHIKPLVGDDVVIDVINRDEFLGNIIDILPRNNTLIRPAVANVDQALVIFAITSPEPNYNLVDRFLIMMGMQDVDTIICFNKKDLVTSEKLSELAGNYSGSGSQIVFSSAYDNEGIEELKSLLENKTTVLAGPSGVGKSSITNLLIPDARMEIGVVSKIGRGKHTTRHSELFNISGKTYILDTPGFTSLSIPELEKEDVRFYYEEFTEYEGKCRFNGCVHVNEPDCAVKKAVEDGLISRLRYDNYLQIYNELREQRKY